MVTARMFGGVYEKADYGGGDSIGPVAAVHVRNANGKNVWNYDVVFDYSHGLRS